MRVISLFSTIVLSLSLAACGSSSGGGGTGRDMFGQCEGEPGQTCTGGDAYTTCVENACDSQFKAALGNDYKSGSFSGPCSSYVSCVSACNCGDNTCQAMCAPSSDCTGSFLALGSCVSGAACTAPVCTGGTSTPDAGSSSSGACNTLNTCCPKLSGANASGCQQVVAANQDNACQQLLSSLGSACN